MSRSRFTGLISFPTCQHLPFLWYSNILPEAGSFYCPCVKAYAHNYRYRVFCQQYIPKSYAFLSSSKCFAYCFRSSVKHGGERHTGNIFCSSEPENIWNRMDVKEKAQPPYSGDCAVPRFRYNECHIGSNALIFLKSLSLPSISHHNNFLYRADNFAATFLWKKFSSSTLRLRLSSIRLCNFMICASGGTSPMICTAPSILSETLRYLIFSHIRSTSFNMNPAEQRTIFNILLCILYIHVVNTTNTKTPKASVTIILPFSIFLFHQIFCFWHSN